MSFDDLNHGMQLPPLDPKINSPAFSMRQGPLPPAAPQIPPPTPLPTDPNAPAPGLGPVVTARPDARQAAYGDPNALSQWGSTVQSELDKQQQERARFERDQMDHDETINRLRTGLSQKAAVPGSDVTAPDALKTRRDSYDRLTGKSWGNTPEADAGASYEDSATFMPKKSGEGLGKPGIDWNPNVPEEQQAAQAAKSTETKPIPSAKKQGFSPDMSSAEGKTFNYKNKPMEIPDFKLSTRGPLIRPWEDPDQPIVNSDEKVKTGVKRESELDGLLGSLDAGDRGADKQLAEQRKGQNAKFDAYLQSLQNQVALDTAKKNPVGSTEKAIADANLMQAKLLQQLDSGAKSSPYSPASPAPSPGAHAGGVDPWAAEYLKQNPVAEEVPAKRVVPPQFELTPLGYKPPGLEPSKSFDYRQDVNSDNRIKFDVVALSSSLKGKRRGR